jgi:hypothetical protein
MEKHSPGPWVEENDGLITDADGNGVGDIYLSEDANLVCAAPELLEALKSLIELGRKDTSNQKYDEYFKDALAAIAKAEGK